MFVIGNRPQVVLLVPAVLSEFKNILFKLFIYFTLLITCIPFILAITTSPGLILKKCFLATTMFPCLSPGSMLFPITLLTISMLVVVFTGLEDFVHFGYHVIQLKAFVNRNRLFYFAGLFCSIPYFFM